MEEKILKKAALAALLVTVIVCACVPLLPRITRAAHQWARAVEEERTREEREMKMLSGLELLEYNNQKAKAEWEVDASLAGGLRLTLPLGVTGNDIKITNDVLTQTVAVSIPYAKEEYLYKYPLLGCSDGIESISFEHSETYGTLELRLDQVYELRTSYRDDYVYLSFLTPHEVYDKVVVIDAGHGGKDFGIEKQGIYEKDINLDIVLTLKEICDDAGDASLGIYYTRTKDASVDFKLRSQFAQKAEADLFISIHSNATESGMMSSIQGTQIVYDSSIEGAGELAEALLRELTALLKSSNKGTREAKDGEDVVFGAAAPAVQIEVGFMTNQEELKRLCSQEYQKKAAQGIYNVILSFLKKG